MNDHSTESRIAAVEALIYALAHHMASDSPHQAQMLAARLVMQCELPREPDENRRLFRSVARVLMC